MPEHQITYYRCSIQGCQNPMPYWNIRFNDETVKWRCRDHIPKRLTFPVSLWNDDWIATGRATPKDPRDNK